MTQASGRTKQRARGAENQLVEAVRAALRAEVEPILARLTQIEQIEASLPDAQGRGPRDRSRAGARARRNEE